MGTGHVLDELSACIDGEAKAPEVIARHLESCGACAQRHRELLELSAQIREDSDRQKAVCPGFSAAFVTRVVARASETVPAPRVWWGRRVSVGFACVGLVVVILGALMTFPRPVQAPQTAGITAPAHSEDASWAAEPERHFAELDVYGESDEVSPEDLVLALGDIEWLAGLAEVSEQQEDMDAAISSLNATEAESLKELLREYAKEDLTI